MKNLDGDIVTLCANDRHRSLFAKIKNKQTNKQTIKQTTNTQT